MIDFICFVRFYIGQFCMGNKKYLLRGKYEPKFYLFPPLQIIINNYDLKPSPSLISFLSPTFSKLLKFPLHFRCNHFLIYTVHKLIIFIILQSFIRFQQFIIFEHQKMCFPKTFNFPINQLKFTFCESVYFHI